MKIMHCGFKRYGRGPYWLRNELGYFIGPVESKREADGALLELDRLGRTPTVLDIRVFAWCMKTGWGA